MPICICTAKYMTLASTYVKTEVHIELEFQRIELSSNERVHEEVFHKS